MTGKPRYIRSQTTKDEGEAYKRLGKLLEHAEEGRFPESRATVGHLLDEYMAVVELEDSTRGMYQGYIRRNIRPALGEMQVRKVRGSMLDRLYAQLRRCGKLCETRLKEEIGADHECRPLAPKTIRQIHTILSGAFGAAVRWDWIERNPAESARLPKAVRRPPTPPGPEQVGTLLTAAWAGHPALAVYIWLAATTRARRGELCALRWHRVDPEAGLLHVARNYLVRGGRRIEKDTKTHQERPIALDAATCQVLAEHRQRCRAALAPARLELAADAYVFSNDGGATPWNPDWTTHQVIDLARINGMSINIKALRHYTATQLLAAGVDIRNTAARLGHGREAPPRCGSTPIQSRRSTNAPPSSWRSSCRRETKASQWRRPELTGKQILRILRRHGCVEVRQRGSHVIVRCGDCQTTVPVHAGEDVGVGLLRSIERQFEPCLGKGVAAMSTYTAVFQLDATGWWFVDVPELPGCHTQGRTIEQARERIHEAMALWLDAPKDTFSIRDDIRYREAS